MTFRTIIIILITLGLLNLFFWVGSFFTTDKRSRKRAITIHTLIMIVVVIFMIIYFRPIKIDFDKEPVKSLEITYHKTPGLREETVIVDEEVVESLTTMLSEYTLIRKIQRFRSYTVDNTMVVIAFDFLYGNQTNYKFFVFEDEVIVVSNKNYSNDKQMYEATSKSFENMEILDLIGTLDEFN